MGCIERLAIAAALIASAASADDLAVSYSVRVDNLSAGSVLFKLDDARPCKADSGASCSWDIVYGSHRLDAYAGDKHFSRDFELSDESDILVRCKFDDKGFSGDSC